MSWHSRPKVRLGLIVNGIYLIYLLTPTAHPARQGFYARAFEERNVPLTTRKAPPLDALVPPSGTPKAASYANTTSDQLDIYLTNDLTLVRGRGRLLLLAPTFTTRASKPSAPPTVLLRFVYYTNGQSLSPSDRVKINADGETVWSESLGSRYNLDAADDNNDGAYRLDNVGINLPYYAFLKAVAAQRVTIEFGPERAVLTREQIDALGAMHLLVSQPRGEQPPVYVIPPRPSQTVPAPVIIETAPDAKPPAKRH